MKRHKNIVSMGLLSILFLILSLSQVISIKAVEKNSGNEEFVIKDNILTHYKGVGTDIVVPEGITAIRSFAFQNCDTIVTVTLPDSVTSIGDSSFSGCDNLTKVVMADTVTSIGYHAFWASVNLKEISSLENVDSIGYDAFGLTLWLKEKAAIDPIVVVNGILVNGASCKGDVVIPNTVTSIADGAVEFNREITSVTIPDTVKTIGIGVFENCTGLVTVIMADSVETMGVSTFKNCINLKNIKLSNSLKRIESGMFQSCKNLETITIPKSVKSIAERAFRYCAKIKNVTISNQLTAMEGENVFAPLTKWQKELTIYGVKGSYIESYAKKNKIQFQPVALSHGKKTLEVSQSFNLRMNSLAECTWKSSNSSIASVTPVGKVTGKKKGTATITAKLYGKDYKCIVTVK